MPVTSSTAPTARIDNSTGLTSGLRPDFSASQSAPSALASPPSSSGDYELFLAHHATGVISEALIGAKEA